MIIIWRKQLRVNVFEFILDQGLARDQLRDAEVRVPPPVPRDVPLRGQQDGGQEPGHRLRPHPRPHRRGQHARHGHGHEPTGTYSHLRCKNFVSSRPPIISVVQSLSY